MKPPEQKKYWSALERRVKGYKDSAVRVIEGPENIKAFLESLAPKAR